MIDSVLIKRQAGYPKELGASAKCLSETTEGFTEVYIDNR
jgi:hypothetical protein